MPKQIIVNANPFETRAAIVEDGRLVEFHVERPSDRGFTGNIYKGTVVRVLPGMQAAFVEIGLQRTAFIHVSDVKAPFDDDDDDDDKPGQKDQRQARIQDVIKEGQQITVQVAKEPIGTKGARVTSSISLPGRYLVLMPGYDRVAVSRRIENDKERRRLKRIVSEAREPGYGFIVRTVCEDMERDQIVADMEFLVKLWKGVMKRAQGAPTPSVLYEELDLTLRLLRDTFSGDYEKIIIDSETEYKRVVSFIDEFMPQLSGRVERHKGVDPIFDAHGIELEISDALEKKVWLRSGGHIVIDQMEALTAIDVNTGKYVGKKNSEATVLKTNLEAADEVVYQLKLRNIGGIIVIDFIDMERPENRSRVYNALKEALKGDKARTNILKISELGIVEMTRKRVRESLGQSLCETCPYCDGNGRVKARDTVIMEIYRELERELPGMRRRAVLYVNADVAARLGETKEILAELEKRFRKKITVKAVDTFHREQFEIV
jgi:ribonuclease G